MYKKFDYCILDLWMKNSVFEDEPDTGFQKLSNQGLLKLAATSFFFFVVAEIIGASMSGSLSLMGDAAAM